METWGFMISFATCQPVPSMPLTKYEVKKPRLFKALTLQAQVRWPTTTPYSSLAACI